MYRPLLVPLLPIERDLRLSVVRPHLEATTTVVVVFLLLHSQDHI
jgi:hypothetical protein